jgi:hypothetical protein
VDAERRRDADANAGMAGARRAGQGGHVARGVAPGPEEVGHHYDLARTPGDAGVDRLGEARPRDREVRRRDAPSRQAPGERSRDRGELAVRGGLAAAVIHEDDGPPASGQRAHQ